VQFVESQLTIRRNMSPLSSGSKNNPRKRPVELVTCFTLVSCLVCFSTIKMEKTCPSETSVDFQVTILLYIPEYRIL
jgi:hypothetical protein